MDLWNAFCQWFFPVNCYWFIAFIIASVVAALAMIIWTVNASSYTDSDGKVVGRPFRTFVRGLVSVVLTLVALAFVVWIIAANNQTVTTTGEERLEIKPVVYPDGRTVQMFTCDGTSYNANSMYSCAPPPGSYVKRLICNRVYLGVYFPPSSSGKTNSSLNDRFILVNPDKTEKQADTLVPGN